MSDIIVARQITHNYGNTRALHGIDLKIPQGSFYGLLGPNGAGKTTTINILCALLIPDEGEIEIKGIDLRKDAKRAKKVLGVVPQDIALYGDLSAIDNLRFWGKLYGLSQTECDKKARALLATVGLAERMNEAVSNYSGGMKRRVNLAAALMHSPDILLMDEPTVGVDPQSRNHIFDLLEELHQRGMTVIYTTHYMEEVERLCESAAIIDHGKIIAQGSVEALKDISREHSSVEIELQETVDENVFQEIAQSSEFKVEKGKNSLIFRTGTPQISLPSILNYVNSKGAKVHKVEIHAPNLESVFLDLTGRRLRD